uniref:hypothetical protein n=1 Tax=Salmonella sp. s54925 TaxID=3159674 RepID=UPI00397ED6B3
KKNYENLLKYVSYMLGNRADNLTSQQKLRNFKQSSFLKELYWQSTKQLLQKHQPVHGEQIHQDCTIYKLTMASTGIDATKLFQIDSLVGRFAVFPLLVILEY